jgi:hypothetical protein
MPRLRHAAEKQESRRMSPSLEDAALILRDMSRNGLVFETGSDPRALLFKIAGHIDGYRSSRPSQADAATRILDDVLSTQLVRYDGRRRNRMIAIIGTRLGNLTLRASASGRSNTH